MARSMKRQGDVLLIPVEVLPQGAFLASRDEFDRVVLAVGEKSGHAHAIRDPMVTSFRMETAEGDLANRAMVDFVFVGGNGAVLAHEYSDERQADHESVTLEPGVWKVVQQRRFAGNRTIIPFTKPTEASQTSTSRSRTQQAFD